MGKKAVTVEMAEEIRRLRELKDGWGDPLWSNARIAERLGLSESTVWRVDRGRAAYGGKTVLQEQRREAARWEALGIGGLPLPEAEGIGEAEIAASLAKVQGMLGRSAGKLEVPDAIKAKADELLGRRPVEGLGNFSRESGSN